MPAVISKPPVVLRDFEKDAAVILEGMGMHLTPDGRWKHFRAPTLKDLTWGDVREFIERNYPRKCPEGRACLMPGHPDFFEEWRNYFDLCRKNIREQKSANTLYRGSGCIVGYAEVPGKLMRALQNDFPEEFGYGTDYASPSDVLKHLERSPALSCFVVNPTREGGK